MLEPVQRMEIGAAVDAHLPAAEPPVCAQEKMVAEYIVVEIVQSPAADFVEIGYIILIQPGVGHFLVLAVARHKGDLTHEFLFCYTVPESRVAGAKDSAQHTVAGTRTAPAEGGLALPTAVNAGFLRQRYRF